MGSGGARSQPRGTRVRTMLRVSASLASDVSQPCICPLHLCLMHLPDLSSEAQDPLFQLWLVTSAAVPYWAETKFEHELPQLLMGSWGLLAFNIPTF